MSWLREFLAEVVTSLIAAWVALELAVRMPRFVERLVERAAGVVPDEQRENVTRDWFATIEAFSSPTSRFTFAFKLLIKGESARYRRARAARDARRSAEAEKRNAEQADAANRMHEALWSFTIAWNASRAGAYGIKGLGWFVCCTVVAPACYAVTSYGAAERAKLASMEERIHDAEKEIRVLETEVATLASYEQLLVWSGMLGLESWEPDNLCQDRDTQCVEVKMATPLHEPKRAKKRPDPAKRVPAKGS